MEQTVTLIKSTGYNFDLYEAEFPQMQAHVQDMTEQGWSLITVTQADRTTTPTMLFWRRG